LSITLSPLHQLLFLKSHFFRVYTWKKISPFILNCKLDNAFFVN
jgi:hypothetical protein